MGPDPRYNMNITDPATVRETYSPNDLGVYIFGYLAGDIYAVEREFNYGRASSICRPFVGRRRDKQGLSVFQAISEEQLQNLQPP